MTIKEFIEAAIEGGWKYKGKHQEIYLCEEQPEEGEGDTRLGIRSNIYAIVLDPEAWRAVGKVKGWDKTYCAMCGQQKPHSKKSECGVQWGRMEESIHYMHLMVDSLRDDRTIEEFIETL